MRHESGRTAIPRSHRPAPPAIPDPEPAGGNDQMQSRALSSPRHTPRARALGRRVVGGLKERLAGRF